MRGWCAIVILPWWLVPLCAAGPGDPAYSPDPLIGITTPARTSSLGGRVSERIAEVLVEEGSTVSAGEPLYRFEDAVARARLEAARHEAESTLDVALAEARWQTSQADYERLNRLHGGSNASAKEISDAHARMVEDKLLFEIAKFEQQLDVVHYQREMAAMAELTVSAPFAGYVSELLHFPGEAPDQQDAVLKLVQLHPLHAVVDCPLALADSVQEGDTASVVAMSGPGAAAPGEADSGSVRQGTVVLKQRVANAASQTFRVKIAIDNADLSWMAGVKVRVAFGSSSSGVSDALRAGGPAEGPTGE